MWIILLGFLSAVIAGLGLGGGMLLQPGLVLLFGKTAAEARLIGVAAYLPMALAAFIINIKNRQIRGRALLTFIPFALFGVLLGSFLAGVAGAVLERVYGVFFVVLGGSGAGVDIFAYVRAKRALKRGKSAE